MSKFAKTMYSSAKQTKNFLRTLNRNIFGMNVIIMALILVVGMMYIVQINSTTATGYHIRDLETQIETLGFENEKLEIAAAEARSMNSVMHGIQMLGMVKTGETEFVSPDAPAVAVNR